MDHHAPLSQSLQQIVDCPGSAGALTLNRLLKQTEGRGLYLVMVLLCLPFVIPFSIPGASLLMGSVIMLISVRVGFNLPPRLPVRIGEKRLPEDRFRRVLSASIKFLKFLEKVVRPRRSGFMSWTVMRAGNAFLISVMAFLLALPLPPIPPFTNTFPSYAIILLALSMMEEDGVMVWVGYAAAAGTVIYFLFMADLISRHLHKFFHLLAS